MKASDLVKQDRAYYEEMAASLVNNWQKFGSFAWHDQPETPNWCIVYTKNRDSDLLTQANADVIADLMARFPDTDIRSEFHHHWACGWVEGYAIRVCDRMKHSKPIGITPAFKRWCDIQASLSDYPLLDDDLYSQMEYDSFIEYIEQELGYMDEDEDLAADVYS